MFCFTWLGCSCFYNSEIFMWCAWSYRYWRVFYEFTLADSTIKKPMGRINDVLILANRNYLPIYFIVLDIDCNLSCPIILGRPFLRTIGVVIDMKEGNIKFQFPWGRVWNTFLEQELGHHMNQSWGHLMDLETRMTKLRSLLYA